MSERLTPERLADLLRIAEAATDGRIYNYWNAEETWAMIRDSEMASLKHSPAKNGGVGA